MGRVPAQRMTKGGAVAGGRSAFLINLPIGLATVL